jgi:hypothetical protein
MLATVQKSNLLLRILFTSINKSITCGPNRPSLRQALTEQQGDLKKYKVRTIPRNDSSER